MPIAVWRELPVVLEVAVMIDVEDFQTSIGVGLRDERLTACARAFLRFAVGVKRLGASPRCACLLLPVMKKLAIRRDPKCFEAAIGVHARCEVRRCVRERLFYAPQTVRGALCIAANRAVFGDVENFKPTVPVEADGDGLFRRHGELL